MNSTVGRPRKLTDAQVAALLDWQRTRRTLRQVAHELGITFAQARAALHRKGVYKQPSPEHRHAVHEARRIRRMTLLKQALW